MKKQQNLIRGLVSILLITCIISTTKAEIPFTEAKGIYVATKKEYKEISPFWAMVAVHGRLLERIRFFGFYTKEGRYDQPLSKKDDHIAALLLKLFPSEDGVQFVVDCNRDTFLKSLSKKENLKEINNIIQVLLSDKKNEDKITDLKTLVGSLTSNSASAKQEWPKLLVNAYEQDQKIDLRYPKNIVIISLLSFFVKVADTREQLITGLPLFFEQKEEVREYNIPYTREGYFIYQTEVVDKQEIISKIIQNAKNTDEYVELLFFLTKGFEAYGRLIAEPLTYRKDISIQGTDAIFPDCGETALRNFVMMLLSAGKNGIVPDENLQFLQDKIKPVSGIELVNWVPYKNFIAFVRENRDMTQGALKKTHDAWADVVSNLNGGKPATALNHIQYGRSILTGTDAPLVYEIKSNFSPIIGAISIINMLNVIAQIIPDEELNETWNGDKNERYGQVAKKLNRLCTLFSREDMIVTWKNESTKNLVIDADFLTIIFNVNDKDVFKWRFQNGHFQIDPISDAQEDWRLQFSYCAEYPNEWMCALFPRTSDIEKEREYAKIFPVSVIYNSSLRTIQGGINTIQIVLGKKLESNQKMEVVVEEIDTKMQTFYPLINRWICNYIPLNSVESVSNMIDLLCRYQAGKVSELIALNINSVIKIAKLEGVLQQNLVALALKNKQFDAANIFIKSGANLNAKDTEGNAPLHLAIIQKNMEILIKLLDAGADPEIKNSPKLIDKEISQCTPLCLAAFEGNLEGVKILLAKGANPNARNESQMTPLISIAAKDDFNILDACPDCIKIMELLIKQGADTKAKDKKGKTFLDYAGEQGHDPIIEAFSK